MRKLISVNQLHNKDIDSIFTMAKKLEQGYQNQLSGKTFALFFPESSIRTRVSYETAIHLLGGNIVNFPSDALDKKEDIQDVVGYLDNWVDGIILRHNDYGKVEAVSNASSKAVINAMTSINHPCEILTDLYTLSGLRNDYKDLTYLFIGPKTNIGNSWFHIAEKLHLSLIQACPEGTEIEKETKYFKVSHQLDCILDKADVVITDGIVQQEDYFSKFQITQERIHKMKADSLLNLTPPFYRGEVISTDVELNSVKQFAGYGFKKNLMYVQAAIILWCLEK